MAAPPHLKNDGPPDFVGLHAESPAQDEGCNDKADELLCCDAFQHAVLPSNMARPASTRHKSISDLQRPLEHCRSHSLDRVGRHLEGIDMLDVKEFTKDVLWT